MEIQKTSNNQAFFFFFFYFYPSNFLSRFLSAQRMELQMKQYI